MISAADCPTICTPSISPYFLSAITFTNPVVSPEANALPFPTNANFPTLISYFSFASSSVRPAIPTSGIVYIAEGVVSSLISL